MSHGKNMVRVHLIDDDPKFLKILTRACEREKYITTQQIFNGDDKTTLLTTQIAGSDIIVVDVGLGLADGIEIAKEIRENMQTWGRTGKVAVMSALPTNRARAKKAGFMFFDKESGMEKKFIESLTL